MGETSTREEYVLRPWGGGFNGYRGEEKDDDKAMEMERTGVNFFFDVFDDLEEWEIEGFDCVGFENTGGNGMEYSMLKLHIHARRRWGYYVWKIGLPLVASTMFCMSSFIFDISELEARNNISVTMFLATAALLYVVASLLPKTSFLTSIDKFVVQTIGIQFIIWAWNLFIGTSWLWDGEAEDKKEWDDAMFAAMFALNVLCALWFFRTPLALVVGMGKRQALVAASRSRYHRFDRLVNVWPLPKTGELPATALEPLR